MDKGELFNISTNEKYNTGIKYDCGSMKILQMVVVKKSPENLAGKVSPAVRGF